MISSTFLDLVEHREAVKDAILRLNFFPLAMEHDSAKSDADVIDSSLAMVDRADAYVGIVSHSYGSTPHDAKRNPDERSVTELEYRRALERRIPIFMYVIG
jgi:hypothetical protein